MLFLLKKKSVDSSATSKKKSLKTEGKIYSLRLCLKTTQRISCHVLIENLSLVWAFIILRNGKNKGKNRFFYQRKMI